MREYTLDNDKVIIISSRRQGWVGGVKALTLGSCSDMMAAASKPRGFPMTERSGNRDPSGVLGKSWLRSSDDIPLETGIDGWKGEQSERFEWVFWQV